MIWTKPIEPQSQLPKQINVNLMQRLKPQGCKSESSKTAREQCFDNKLKIEAKTNAKPLAELKREVEEAAVDGKVTHFL